MREKGIPVCLVDVLTQNGGRNTLVKDYFAKNNLQIKFGEVRWI